MVTTDLIEEIKNRLVSTYHPLAIYLFGSYAWGSPSDDSDVDILVVVDSSEEKTFKRAVAGHHSLFGLRVSKDLIVLTKQEFERESANPSSLCFKIQQKGKLLYAQ
jgi:predicted nucleotidyltransferase